MSCHTELSARVLADSDKCERNLENLKSLTIVDSKIIVCKTNKKDRAFETLVCLSQAQIGWTHLNLKLDAAYYIQH